MNLTQERILASVILVRLSPSGYEPWNVAVEFGPVTTSAAWGICLLQVATGYAACISLNSEHHLAPASCTSLAAPSLSDSL